MIEQYVLDLQEIDETQVAVVGGKGAHLGGLSGIEGIRRILGIVATRGRFDQAASSLCRRSAGVSQPS
ncbi:hypothetical protein, partial [Streptomyces sp. NPDC006971]|uniref:hypothetical protein n=1 Tax=Streptomyces sp. NPDC006971 TaxID=3154784 RepID=UPI0033D945CF